MRHVAAWCQQLLITGGIKSLQAALKDKSDSSAIPIMRSPDAYLLQEKMLASVHNYILSVFKSPRWSFSSPDLLDPTGSTHTDTDWKRLSDQVWGAGCLFREATQDGGSMKLRRILLDMENVVGTPDPQFMVRIWRICRYLHGICTSTGDEDHLKARFLHRFRELLRTSNGEASPIFQFFDALASMDMNCFLRALRIGNLRALHTFEQTIGPGHPMILTMWVYYSKQWRVAEQSYEKIIEYYNCALQTADASLGSESDTAISILHDYTYFVYYGGSRRDNTQAAILATQLYDRTYPHMLDSPCNWNNKTQYFTFASQILAEYWFLQGIPYWATGYIEKASSLLQVSDRECQIRARMLLGKLRGWLIRWGSLDEAQRVKQRQVNLMASIDELLQREIQDYPPDV
ncbi:hypothetical protein BDW66DRAFT_165864 [Aspergillus desertorum]